MMSPTMRCQWLLLSIGTVLILPVIEVASTGITRHRSSMSHHRREHQHPSSSFSSSSAWMSSSGTAAIDNQVKQDEAEVENTYELPVISKNITSPSLPLIQDGGEIKLPRGFKIVALDENDTPIIIIPNMHHLLENNSDLTKLIKSALREAHRNKRSPSTSSGTSSSRSSTRRSCTFEYRTTVTRQGQCIRFGDFPACLSGDQLYPFAREC